VKLASTIAAEWANGHESKAKQVELLRHLKPFNAVIGNMRHESLNLQKRRKRVGSIAFVIDDQHFADWSLVQ
jgi:hypothetical protein